MSHSIDSGRALVRPAERADLEAIRTIYNQGIEDRCATLETSAYDADDMASWWRQHDDKYAVLVAENDGGEILGWASLNKFSHRCAHSAIADLSVYVARSHRGHGVGQALLEALESRGRGIFRKIVLHALNDNQAGKQLYRKRGFREVGVFEAHGELDGRLINVVAMEKLLE